MPILFKSEDSLAWQKLQCANTVPQSRVGGFQTSGEAANEAIPADNHHLFGRHIQSEVRNVSMCI